MRGERSGLECDDSLVSIDAGMNRMTTAKLDRERTRLKVLVVEDEAIISFLIEDMLRDLGYGAIAHAGSVHEALNRIAAEPPDFALLDVNLGGELAFPVAERLEAESIPFLFATGYGRKGIPEFWAARPVIEKPFDTDLLALALRELLSLR